MKNIIATIPKGRFKTWELAERVVKRCDGETWFWTLRMPRKPKTDPIGSLCYMIYDGQVRGYFDIVNVDEAKNWEWHQEREQEGFVLVLANWHPAFNLPQMTGFQGWRYTSLRP